jgi:hypothetical protein
MSIYFLSPSPSRSPLARIQRVCVIAFPRHGPMVAELHPWWRHRQRAARLGPRFTNHCFSVLRDATDSTNPTKDLPERGTTHRRVSTADSGPRRRHDLGDELEAHGPHSFFLHFLFFSIFFQRFLLNSNVQLHLNFWLVNW